MKQIDVIFPAYLNATVGPCGTLRRLIKNKENLEKRGYDVNIFTLDSVKRKDPATNVPVDYSKGLGLRNAIKKFLFKCSLGYALIHNHDVNMSKRLVKYYKSLNRKADVVVFHETNACAAYMPYRDKDQKIVCFFHDDGTRWGMTLNAHPYLKESWLIKYYDRLMDQLLPNIDRYVFISKLGQENFLLENPNIERLKTSFFHNGIEDYPLINIPPICERRFRLCSVGSLSHRKGQYLIVEALHNLPNYLQSQIYLTLYGMGEDYDYIKTKVEEYGLQNSVCLYGNLNNKDIHTELSKHNIFLLMSNNEGLPISIIEAMRAGLPIISTRVSGIPEEVDERNGILINPDEGELTTVLSNIEKYDWEKMGNNSRLRFENEFTFNSMLQGYCDMLDETLKENHCCPVKI